MSASPPGRKRPPPKRRGVLVIAREAGKRETHGSTLKEWCLEHVFFERVVVSRHESEGAVREMIRIHKVLGVFAYLVSLGESW